MRVDELKNKILQLAIQGKLVPQDENDIPASVLLEEIKKEKEQLIKEKKIKKEKPLPEITEEEKPFEIPKGWEWCRLGEICIQITDGVHKTPNYISEGVPFLSIKNISQGYFDFSDVKYISKEQHNELTKRCKPEFGDLLFCRIGTLGRFKVIDIEDEFSIFVSLGLIKLGDKISPKYAEIMLNSPFLYSQYYKIKVDGSHTSKLNLGDIPKVIIPLPSVAEQLRIVQKVDELFEIIDELSENKEAMIKNISDTRNKVLQLAIQGKLVEQNPEDTPASVLLEEIRKEKETLIKEKKIKKEKPLPEITEEEKPFKIPKRWEWVRLGDISTIRGGKRVPAGYKLLDTRTDYMYIRVADMKNGTILSDDIKYISQEIYDKIKNYYIESDDIYITIAGTIGRVGTVPEKFNGANLTENASKIKCYKVNKEFVFRVLNSDFVQRQISDKTKKVGQPKLALNQIQSLVIPLPSVEEQQRIVQKVDEIMAYLDELEKTILNDSII